MKKYYIILALSVLVGSWLFRHSRKLNPGNSTAETPLAIHPTQKVDDHNADDHNAAPIASITVVRTERAKYFQGLIARGDGRGFQELVDEIKICRDDVLAQNLLDLLLSVRSNKNMIRPVLRGLCEQGPSSDYTEIIQRYEPKDVIPILLDEIKHADLKNASGPSWLLQHYRPDEGTIPLLWGAFNELPRNDSVTQAGKNTTQDLKDAYLYAIASVFTQSNYTDILNKIDQGYFTKFEEGFINRSFGHLIKYDGTSISWKELSELHKSGQPLRINRNP